MPVLREQESSDEASYLWYIQIKYSEGEILTRPRVVIGKS